MKIGFGVPVSGAWATPDIMARVVTKAEELGYHGVWTFQRLLYPEGHPMGPVYRNVHDPLITLAYLAGITRRIGLGVAVVNMPFHSPALLAKQLATVQTISGGRLTAGLGLGWVPEEFAASGVPYGRRGARGEEYVRVLRALWTEDVAEYEGTFYRLSSVYQGPKPNPVPQLLLGGTADVALRRAGRIADGWVSSSREDLTAIGARVALVKEAAREAGRDPETLRFVCRGVTLVRPGGRTGRPLTGSYEEIRRDVAALAEQGVTEIFHDLNFDPEIVQAPPQEALRRAEEALEALAPT